MIMPVCMDLLTEMTGRYTRLFPGTTGGWHCGSGSKGSGNNTHIGVEMCEPACIRYTSGSNFTCSDLSTARAVAKRTYEAAVELFAMLCKQYNLNPTADGVIVSHREGHSRGIASNHGDPEHLWNDLGMGYTMDGFRKAVKAAMGGSAARGGSSSGRQQLWNFRFPSGSLYGKGDHSGSELSVCSVHERKRKGTDRKRDLYHCGS